MATSSPGNSHTHDIVGKLWNLCNVLKDDGVTYHQYVTELTYLLFLKMAKETGQEQGLPEEWRWDALETLDGPKQMKHYQLLLLELGSSESGSSPLVQEIYSNASSFIKKPVTLTKLVSEIDKLDWYSARQEGLGDLYEGLLQKNAEEKKSGAGQYFTPRPLIDSMVAVMQPTLEDVIQDPAAGTGGFPIAAQHWIRNHHEISQLDEKQQKKFYERTSHPPARSSIASPQPSSPRPSAASWCPRTPTTNRRACCWSGFGRPARRKPQPPAPRGVVGARLQPARIRALLMPPQSLPIGSPRCCANAAP